MSNRFRKLLVSVVLIVLLLVGGVMISGWLYRTKPEAERTAEPSPPPLVEVVTVERTDVREVFVGYGSARADRDVVIASELAGVVTALAPGLNDGTAVTAGELLVEIDDRQYVRQVSRTEAGAADLVAQIARLEVERDNIGRLGAIAEQELEVNRDELTRLGELFERDLASRKEYDFARLAYQQSRRQLQAHKNDAALIEPRRLSLRAALDARLAEAELARLDVERCRIRAPFSGQVVRMSVEIGVRVQPGGEILRLMSTQHIEVPIELPASVRPSVEVGARCLLEVDSMRDAAWRGTLGRLSPAADTRSRTFAAYVDVDNGAQEIPLIPGYFVKAAVDGPLLRQVVAIPRGVVVGQMVFVADGTTARSRPVHVERFVGERAVVTGDLRSGDRLIVTNLDVLHDGADIRVRERIVVGDGGDEHLPRPAISESGS